MRFSMFWQMRERATVAGWVAAVAVTVATVLSVTAWVSSRTLANTHGWERVDLRAVTQPAAVGNRFVFYVADRGGLQVVALDARTGATVWAAAATPSEIAPGEPPELAVIGSDVFYLGRQGGSLGE